MKALTDAGRKGASAFILAVAAASAGPAPAGEVSREDLAGLEGRYTAIRRLQMLDPERSVYLAADVLEIEAIGARRARISLTSHFPNGHSCTIEGKAKLSRGALLLRERRAGADGRLCRLVVRRQGERMRWSDGGSCASYCGMRGTLTGSLPYGSRAGPR